MPVERCHHRFHPKTSGIPGACPAGPGLSCRKPRAPHGCQEPRNSSQATLKLISSTTTLYGPIHLNQSYYSGNEPRWRISLRSNYPLCLLHLFLPASLQALILLSVPSCSGAAPLPQYLCRGRPFRTEGLCQRYIHSQGLLMTAMVFGTAGLINSGKMSLNVQGQWQILGVSTRSCNYIVLNKMLIQIIIEV